ncbi:MAG: Efflux ABC transporter, ATP-binding protein [Candidatus Bipolaricaulis sibiricus]|uniref:Efflux ABC transporter, ATP-binding protein n=1 Tax=Bipolaricaulis sibiricus TaxID=2501609 RepID=A0A410FS92_BIPS1|nr:MAG: Efflux ABC transporter, ATP-binding protein [Candidatus Bipolaricaulis sibiricus]
MNDIQNAVEVEALRKVFERHARRGLLRRARAEVKTLIAVDGIDFRVKRGEIFGLLGPNGAGKTTTIKMLCTLLSPTSGTARVAGHDVVRDAAKVRSSLGTVLTGERSVYWKLTGRENLRYYAALYRIPRRKARERIAELLERLELAGRADELVEKYSSGMKQRLALARALLPSPPILLLDEPTVGLDPQAARNLRQTIVDLRAEGKTVLLTTHYMAEADELCDRIAIIDQGKIIALDSPAALREGLGAKEVIRIEIQGEPNGLGDALRALASVESVAVRPSTNGVGTCELQVITSSSRRSIGPIIEAVRAAGHEVVHLQVVQPTLEDVFISLTGKSLRD